MDKFLKFRSIVKVDETSHMVYGVACDETVDSDNEIADYQASKAAFQKWAEDSLKKTEAAGQDPSLGNIRVMHQLQIGGKAVKIDFDDANKRVMLGSEPASDDVWKLLKGGFLTGYSIGGGYAYRDPASASPRRYHPEIGEVSYVDRPANDSATFTHVKADGSIELRKFQKPGQEELAVIDRLKKACIANLSDEDVKRIAKALEDSLEKGTKYLVPDGQHLPYTDESGKPDHNRMGAAWAALHGGYRGNKYEGPGKEHAIARLKEIYHSEGMEPPSEKCLAADADLRKAIEQFNPFGDLSTELEKFNSTVAGLVRQLSSEEGNMTAEELKKAQENLEKAKSHLAALHGHLSKAIAHHAKLADHVSAKGESIHKAMGEHMDNAMECATKAMGAEEAEKAVKAVADDVKKIKDAVIPKDEPAKAFDPNAKEFADAVAKAVSSELEKQRQLGAPTDNSFKVRLIGRDGNEIKPDAMQKAAMDGDPLPIV